MGAASTELTITPPEPEWLDLSPYQDVVAFLEVQKVNNGGGAGILSLLYQTAPMKDEAWFTTAATITPLPTGVTVTKMVAKLISNPLSRWFRWQLSMSGPTANWDATFRIWLAASAVKGR
jgi:hypothetical protein